MMGCRKEASCRNLFRILKILPLMSQYILSLTMFIIKNKNQFTVNSEIHSINTRQHTSLHQPTSNFAGCQQGIYYSGVRVYNNLPSHIKQLSYDTKNFFPPMPPHVLMNFHGFPPGHGDSVADFRGWNAHEARLRCPDDVSGDMQEDEIPGGALSLNQLTTQTMVTTGIFP